MFQMRFHNGKEDRVAGNQSGKATDHISSIRKLREQTGKLEEAINFQTLPLAMYFL